MDQFSTHAVVVDILEELGYQQRQTSAWRGDTLQHKEFEVHPSYVKFRTSYGITGHKRFCILRITKGQQVHIHGSEINCIFINLADPGSIDSLRSAISSAEESNGYQDKS